VKSPKSFFLGCIVCLYALHGLITGITYFPRKHDSGFWDINRYDDFASYWVIISILFYFGINSIKEAFVKTKQNSKLTPLNFKDINEYNNFKSAEKLLGTAPYIWGMAGVFIAFPFWYLVDYNFNLTTNNCAICKIDEDWSNLILASSMILFPVIFYKLSSKIIFNRLINNGTITASSFKHMRSPRKATSKSDRSGNEGYNSDSSGDCGGGGGE
jgi:hypothetical protein